MNNCRIIKYLAGNVLLRSTSVSTIRGQKKNKNDPDNCYDDIVLRNFPVVVVSCGVGQAILFTHFAEFDVIPTNMSELCLSHKRV